MSEANAAAPAPAQPAVAPGPQVVLQKIYLKDASVEIPGAPQVFTRNEQPQVDVALNTSATTLGNDTFQVLLSVTVTGKLPAGETAFLVEVQQAGIFTLSNIPNPADVQAVLGTFCPNTLFPFAREAVADLVQRAGFPPMLLQPVNFDALYIEHRDRRAAQQPAGTAANGAGDAPMVTH